MFSSFESSEVEKKEMQEDIENLHHKIEEMEAKQIEQAAAAVQVASAEQPKVSSARPTHSAGHRRPSSARPPSRPLSSSRKEMYDDSPRDTEYTESKSSTPINTHRNVSARRDSGQLSKEIAKIKIQVDALKDAMFNKLMKSQMPKSSKSKKTPRPKSSQEVVAAEAPAEGAVAPEEELDIPVDETEIDGEEEVAEESNFSMESMLQALFPDDKLESKVESILN